MQVEDRNTPDARPAPGQVDMEELDKTRLDAGKTKFTHLKLASMTPGLFSNHSCIDLLAILSD